MILHENKEGESPDQPVHILILVSIDDLTVFHPCHGGLGYARGLAGQSGLNVDRNRHIQTTIRDGRRDCEQMEGVGLSLGFVLRVFVYPECDLPYTWRSTLLRWIPA